MKLIAYVRVSREDENPENQLYAIKQYCSLKGYVVVDVVVESGVSGALEPNRRVGFRRVVDALKSRLADGVIVYALDRIARSLWSLAEIFKTFDENGWVIMSVREDWINILDKHIKNLIIAIIGWAGEMERMFISERTKEALRRVRNEGRKLGRPRIPEEKISEVLKLMENGMSMRRACMEVGVSYSTVKRKIKELMV